MEVKINREIRNYTESMFFGLSMRQFIFSVLACGVAVGLYFILRPYFGVETLSWMCILGAAPFAMLGFVTYFTSAYLQEYVAKCTHRAKPVEKKATYRNVRNGKAQHL